jgi:transcriptional regulator with XRE-family HTH domain
VTTTADLSALLTVRPEGVLTLIDRLLGQTRRRLASRLREALQEPSARTVERYVRDYHEAGLTIARGLDQATAETPAPLTVLLDLAAAEAPYSPWVIDHGPDGVWLDLVARLRRDHDDAEPLPEPQLSVEARREWERRLEPSLLRFHRHVLRALARRDDTPPLERVQRALDLSVTDLGRLFGVSRQAAAKWLESGDVPADRQGKLASVAAVCDLLERKLKPGRLPGVARRRAETWGGLGLLEMVERDREQELLDSVRASFDWSVTA